MSRKKTWVLSAVTFLLKNTTGDQKKEISKTWHQNLSPEKRLKN